MLESIPAVVVGADINGLGVVRSLAHGRTPTILVDTTRRRAGMWSRFTRAAVLKEIYGRSLIEGLLTIQDKLRRRPVLIVTDERAVSTVSECRDELGAYKFQLPPRNIVAMLQNNALFHEFAVRHELTVPRAIVVKPDTSLSDLSKLPFPVAVKSAERWIEGSGGRQQVHFAATLREAEALCRRLLESGGEPLVQEWIDGPDSNICFALFYLGHMPEHFKVFTGRKLASHPEKLGGASLCLAAPEVTDALEPLIAKLLDITEFRGLGRIEFKWDAQKRQYAILGAAVGLTDWHAEIATLSGINLPLAAYRDEVGLPFAPSGGINRAVAWRGSARLGRALPMQSPSMHIYDGYWRLNDPLPAFFFHANAAIDRTYRHLVEPIFGGAKPRDMQSALERMYQGVVKAIFHRGKASTP